MPQAGRHCALGFKVACKSCTCIITLIKSSSFFEAATGVTFTKFGTYSGGGGGVVLHVLTFFSPTVIYLRTKFDKTCS